MRIKVTAALVFTLLIAGWQLICSMHLVPAILLPDPVGVAKYLFVSTKDGTLPAALITTLVRLLFGFGLGLCLGVIIGLALYKSRLAKATLGVLALGLQTLPSVCWAPLALLWFGQTETAMYFVVVMGSLWAIALASESSIRSVPEIYIQAARVLGSKGFHTWRTVIPGGLTATGKRG